MSLASYLAAPPRGSAAQLSGAVCLVKREMGGVSALSPVPCPTRRAQQSALRKPRPLGEVARGAEPARWQLPPCVGGGAKHMNHRPEPSANGATLLVVNERAEHRASLRAALEAEGHRVLTAESARVGLGLLDADAAAVLIVEQRLCAVYGDALAHRLRERDGAAQVVVVAAGPEGTPPRTLLSRLGLHGYHAATDGPARLLVLVDAALAAHYELARFQLAE